MVLKQMGLRLKKSHSATPGRTVLGAVSLAGWVAVMSAEAATEGDVFLAHLEHVLCPRLKPGQLVVMDNLGAHKGDGVRKLIEQSRASVCYLPPYSPDFNPIEKCWAQMKQKLRAFEARSVMTLQQGLAEALATLSPQNAASCFRHCGYPIRLF